MSKLKRLTFLIVALPLLMLALGQTGWAQGCVVPGRGGPSMTGGRHSSMLLPDDCSWMSPQRWSVGIGYRYFHSHRHFVGSEEQNNRKQQGSEVNNKVTIWDIATTYQVNNRWSVSLDVPVLSMDRWSQRTPTQVSQADGIGDINVMSRMWLFTP